MPATVIGTRLLAHCMPWSAIDFLQISLAYSPDLLYAIVVWIGVEVDESILPHIRGYVSAP
jgi:hypothetical protein